MKERKTVELRMLIPYAIIMTMIVAGGTFIAGWHTHQNYQSQVSQDAKVMVEQLGVMRETQTPEKDIEPKK